MFGFIKGLFHKSDDLEHRRAAAIAQDKKVRDSMSQKDLDRNVMSSMHNSDSIAKY